jgi:hypothetical protein
MADKSPGFELRDLFAAMAMASIFTPLGANIVAARDKNYDETNWAEIVARNAYDMADAMLVERNARALARALRESDGHADR